ncbi:MAG: hypothetical protein ACXWOV_10665, partial [Isosphaeraceae bacterium]
HLGFDESLHLIGKRYVHGRHQSALLKTTLSHMAFFAKNQAPQQRQWLHSCMIAGNIIASSFPPPFTPSLQVSRCLFWGSAIV